MLSDELLGVAALLRSQRQAALGTLADGAPVVSMVAFAAEPGFGGVLLHLSGLAAHTRQLLADPRCSLLIAEPDDGRDDVQTLARLTLACRAAAIPHDTPEHEAARATYLARLPAAEMLFGLGDFGLFRLVPEAARFVGGFARAYTLTPEHLRQAAVLATEDTEGTE